jgi:3-vinyl bacteriochlorophyllide hydratase
LHRSRQPWCFTHPISAPGAIPAGGQWFRQSSRPCSSWLFWYRWCSCYLATGDGYTAATVSILVKTGLLYAIMVTGAIWEKVVFGQYLFAPAFFWEDVVSFVVIALHTLYLYGLLTQSIAPMQLMLIALAAYATYFLNATQFLLKLRRARLDSTPANTPGGQPA